MGVREGHAVGGKIERKGEKRNGGRKSRKLNDQ
jgi:hypothetical protein